IRTEYSKESLEINDVNSNPVEQFKKWFEEALQAEVMEPSAMNLATISSQGRPSSRIMLLKGVENQKFIFYTNYESNKGKDIIANPFVALNFFWPELERQVRVEGIIKKVSAETSDSYFKSRPRSSQIGAWVSEQSHPITDRKILEERYQQLVKKYEGQEIPRPSFWGGYKVIPERIEFWQGRPSRLHDRLSYTKESNNNWKIERLSP
ncbi:pyridoxamine 5'-phosphate oxidase, partial [Cytophagales bacterium RKSG123]